MRAAPYRETREALSLLERLAERGISFIVTGGAAVSLLLNERSIIDDIDLLVLSPDPVLEEEAYYGLAEHLGCELERNSMGGPRLVFDDGFALDFFSPSLNIEVPQDVLESYEVIRTQRGFPIKVASLEAVMVLKSQAIAWESGDIDSLRDIARKAAGRLDRREIDRLLGKFEEGRRRMLSRILQAAGI